MKQNTLLALIAAGLASLALYLLLFGFVLSKPMTVDELGRMLNRKLAYAHAAMGPKIVLIGGSNVRYSHSCATIETILKRPCVNLGLTAEVGMDWVLGRAREDLHPGDLVYLSFEYAQFHRSRESEFSGMDAAYNFRHDKRALLRRGAAGVIRAAFMYTLSDLIESVGEMALNRLHVRRRLNDERINLQGDQIGHTPQAAARFAMSIRAAKFDGPSALRFGRGGMLPGLGAFLEWCRSHGVVVVGGLPTTFDDYHLNEDVLRSLQGFYAAHGARFLILANRSQYPRADFFDTPYHLQQPFQIAHSVLLAKALRPYLPKAAP